MALYEHVFLLRQDISTQQVGEIVEQYKKLIEENGGKVCKVENWGLRVAAYRIQKNRKVYYILMNIDAPSASVQEMERQMRINENVLRYLTVAVKSHEEGPSVMMQKRDRDDRNNRPMRDRNVDRKRHFHEEKTL
ncbi:30S ribosomal protein S6 [Candidatus Liberibacter sp.]|uniref:30S ribosomal protein S6 n=1 Tax=Candidatus Liberibacter sp. TaxID=34022 RepID=UPI0015F69AB6|nr:30S ribosomal protein S6 [Candidatus Liberibacter sp.]MBA5724334.1 30S ribosomal protein S6 [Candidatus Liberibacter sp.]